MTRLLFLKSPERETAILDLIHSDVCSPMRVELNGKAKYYLTFIDDHSRCCEVKFIYSKKEVIEKKVKEFIKMVENR